MGQLRLELVRPLAFKLLWQSHCEKEQIHGSEDHPGERRYCNVWRTLQTPYEEFLGGACRHYFESLQQKRIPETGISPTFPSNKLNIL